MKGLMGSSERETKIMNERFDGKSWKENKVNEWMVNRKIRKWKKVINERLDGKSWKENKGKERKLCWEELKRKQKKVIMKGVIGRSEREKKIMNKRFDGKSLKKKK